MKISKLTKEQEAQIPIFIERYIKLAEKPTDKVEATKAVQALYESANFKKPIVIFGKNPIQTAIMVAMCKILFKDSIVKEDSQLDSQLGSQLYSQLRSQLDSQLRSQLRSQLYSQLYSQLRSQLDIQLDSQLRSQLRSQLGSQLGSQLHSQLYSQLYSQLGSQLYSQLDSQIGSQLRSQLGSQIGSQLYSQLHSQLGSQLYSQLYSQIGSQLDKINKDWWLITWWITWAAWYAFGEYIGVKFNDKILKIFTDFVTNVSFIIPYEGIAFVSETPEKISWSNGLLHNANGPAVKYGGDYGLYALNGVRFDKKLYEKVVSGKMPFEKIMAIADIDQRTQAMRFGDVRKFLDHAKAKKLDEKQKSDLEGNTINYELFMIPKGEIFREDAYYMIYSCPSTKKVYMSGVEPFQNVESAMAWKQSITPDMWLAQIPLKHES